MPPATDVLAEHGFHPGVDESRQDDFLEACEQGLVDVVRAYLDLGMPVEARGTKGDGPALMTAAEAGSIAVIELLVARGADLEHRDDWGDTALRSAINRDYEAVVRRLVELGASPDAPNEDGESAIEHAIVEEKPDNLALLLGLGANASLVCAGRSAVRAAITRNNEDALAELLHHGAAPSLVLDGHGVTALHEAVRIGNMEAVDLLLAYDADRGAKDAYGLSALDYALEADDEDLVALLGEPGAHQSARARMWQQLADGEPDEALATLERDDLPIETRNMHHHTMLIALAAAGHADGVRRLLARGANPAPPGVATAASEAIAKGHHEVLDLLIAAGAPLFDVDGKLPGLDQAAWAGGTRMVRRVFEHSTPAQRATLGEYVHAAVLQDDMELLPLLIEHRVPLDHTSRLDGDTPLMRAVSSSFSTEIATRLLDGGAALDSADRERGQTALHKLVGHPTWDDERERMLRALLDRGARLDALDHQRRTPYDVASDSAQSALARLAVEKIASDPPVEAVVPGQSWATLPMFAVAGHADWALRLIDAGVAFQPPPGVHGLFDQAVAGNDVALVEALIARGADVNRCRSYSYSSTPLISAASRGHAEIVQRLLAAGADVNAIDWLGNTAAHAAASHPALLPLLAAAGARFDQRACPPIISAAHAGNPISLEFFLAHGAVIDGVSRHGANALISAITRGHEAIALRLIAAGASPTHAARVPGELPITAAAKRGQVAVVKALLAAGAAPNEKDAAGDDALTLIARRSELREAFADVLAEHGTAAFAPRIAPLPAVLATVTPGWAAVYAGERWAIDEMLDTGQLGVNDRDPWGVTPLMAAVQVRAQDLVADLLERGADPMIEDPNGNTAWDHGGFWQRDELIDRALEAHGATLSQRRLDGQAARSLLRDEFQRYLDGGEYPKLVAAIRERRLHPHLGINGRSLVIDAIERNDEDLLAVLIDLGLPLELCSAYSDTPLASALTHHRFELAQRLVTAGVSTRIPGLLQHFLDVGNTEAVDWILSHGLDADLDDEDDDEQYDDDDDDDEEDDAGVFDDDDDDSN